MHKFATLLALLITVASTNQALAENPQHERMRNCNKTAKEQALKGDERRAFMKTCLSGKHVKDADSEAATTPVPEKES